MRVMIIGVAVLFFTLFTYNTIEAQSAVYVCTKTGRYGVAFDDGNAPRMNANQTRSPKKMPRYRRRRLPAFFQQPD